VIVLTLPAAAGGFMEQIQFSACTVLAGRMGPVESAAYSLLLNIVVLFFLIYMAMGEATGIRMAQFLGDGSADFARFAAYIGFSVCAIIGAVVGILATDILPPLGCLVSHDVEVRHEFLRCRWAFGITIAGIGLLLPLVTLLTKQGRTLAVSVVIPLCCWCVGLPVSAMQSRAHGLLGIFEGLMTGYGLAVMLLLVVFLRSDWAALVRTASQRAEQVQEMA